MNSVKDIKDKRNKSKWINEISFEQLPQIKDIAFIKDEIVFVLDDDRIIYIPLS